MTILQRHSLSKILCLLIFSFNCGAVIAKEKVPDMIPGTMKITAEQLIELVETKDDLVIIDARKKADRELGFIEGSINLTDTDTNAETLAAVIRDKNTPVIFYCNGINCGRSVKSSQIALGEGYQNIYWFRGGWDEWTEKSYPVSH